MHTCPKTSLLYRVYERSAVVDLRCYNLQGVCPVNVAVSSSSPQLPPNQSSTLKRVDNHHHSCTWPRSVPALPFLHPWVLFPRPICLDFLSRLSNKKGTKPIESMPCTSATCWASTSEATDDRKLSWLFLVLCGSNRSCGPPSYMTSNHTRGAKPRDNQRTCTYAAPVHPSQQWASCFQRPITGPFSAQRGWEGTGREFGCDVPQSRFKKR